MENKIQLCEECGCFVFYGRTMKCANGHDIDISKLTRDDVVSFYVIMIEDCSNDLIIADFNKRIINRWSDSALVYIKEKAWKQIASNKLPNNFVFGI